MHLRRLDERYPPCRGSIRKGRRAVAQARSRPIPHGRGSRYRERRRRLEAGSVAWDRARQPRRRRLRPQRVVHQKEALKKPLTTPEPLLPPAGAGAPFASERHRGRRRATAANTRTKTRPRTAWQPKSWTSQAAPRAVTCSLAYPCINAPPPTAESQRRSKGIGTGFAQSKSALLSEATGTAPGMGDALRLCIGLALLVFGALLVAGRLPCAMNAETVDWVC